MPLGRVTERSYYTDLKAIVKEAGGRAVSEISFNGEPDILFDLIGREWVLSVKIGETPTLLKSAFIQYQRHKDETGRKHGLLLLLPEAARSVPAQAERITEAVQGMKVACLVDTPLVKEEFRDATFAEVLTRLVVELRPRLAKKERTAYPLQFVISLLQEHVTELMQGIRLSNTAMLRIITDKKLLSGLGHLPPSQAEEAAHFLAAYILLSQMLFLRLFSASQPGRIPAPPRPVTPARLRSAFEKILEINYRPIYELDILDLVPATYLADTYDLISGLEVERSRYELPGRIFHELMPKTIRKMLAAFYTRPQAAELLARLSIHDPEATILDPACGSGTILVSAYRRKLEMFRSGKRRSNPHRRFCEEQIFGADIMPFAVHLTCANLAAMDVAETIQKTLIVQHDSLEMVPGKAYEGGVHQFGLFAKTMTGRTTSGEEYPVTLPQPGVDCVIMNPPFTKVERGIADYVDMKKFKERVGGEVGLWGHFIALTDVLLKKGSRCGAVIPISIMRGRESERVRKFVFQEWTPRYLVKSTRSYAFSENAEYRDILFIADREPARPTDKVKVCYVKKNLAQLAPADVEHMAEQMEGRGHYRSPDLDIETHAVADFRSRPRNMLWFLGTEDMAHRDVLLKFWERFRGSFEPFPTGYFSEGYRPVPQGVSDFLFLTRASNPGRVQEAFLRFTNDRADPIRASTEMGTEFEIAKTDVMASLRTPVGLTRMDISRLHDYIASGPYREWKRVRRAAGTETTLPKDFWIDLEGELTARRTRIVVARRLDFGSPNFHLSCWVADSDFAPANQVNIIRERDMETAQAVCVLLNSVMFWAQFFLLKEQSHARYADIRFYDLDEMRLFPPALLRKALAAIYLRYRSEDFPAFREQLDQRYTDRLEEYWESQESGTTRRLFRVLDEPVRPSPIRLSFDKETCAAVGLTVSDSDLIALYEVMAKEIIITRRLLKD